MVNFGINDTKLEDGTRVLVESFDSLGDLVTHASGEGVNQFTKNNSVGTDWNGTRTFQDAVKLALNGWEEGTAKIEKYVSMFTGMLGSLLQVDEYFYDVSGQDFDLDRVLIGEPEAWLNTEQVQVQAPALHTIKIVVNIMASAAVSTSAITMRGAAIAALVLLLEKARRNVELEVICSSSAEWDGREVLITSLTVKRAGESIDLSKLAFVLTHPSMLRRFMFGCMENCSDKKLAKKISRGHGCPSDVCLDKGDIYCGRLLGYYGEQEAGNWIKENLEGQGIELKGAVYENHTH